MSEPTIYQHGHDDSAGGLTMLFVFLGGALIITLGVAFMAASRNWVAMGIMFAGDMLLTAAVIETIEHYMSGAAAEGRQAEEAEAALKASERKRAQGRQHRARIAFHH
jgi:hypothetical protein